MSLKTLFKEDNGNWSWVRVRGAITLIAAIGLAFYRQSLDQWTVMLILGWSGIEAICKTWQKRMEK